MLISGFARYARLVALAVVACGFVVSTAPSEAFAQSIEAVVNGDPITTSEVDDQIKFLKVIRRPATRDAAVEDLIADRIKLKEANRNGLDATESDLTQTLNRLAKSVNMQPDAMAGALQRAKANSDSIRNHLRAVSAWNNYVRSRNKALNVSEEDITAALAKDTGRAKQDADFTLQQILFVVPTGASAATVEQRTREAQALRSRFENCTTGLQLARALPDVAIKPPITRSANSMSAATRATLDQTPRGRLTNPERTPAGVEVIAVCGHDDAADTTTLRENVQADLVTERLATVADKMYRELRAIAVVEKHGR